MNQIKWVQLRGENNEGGAKKDAASSYREDVIKEAKVNIAMIKKRKVHTHTHKLSRYKKEKFR
jgi:hypothetical protein